MKDQIWERWPCQHRRETSATPFKFYHSNRESSETRPSHVRTSTGKTVAMFSNKRESSPHSNVVQEPYSEREKSF